MLRTAAKKVAWVGRTASMVFGLALVLALLFGVATMAMGATGGNFVLGKVNIAGTATKLTSNIAGPVLQLVNTSTNSAATALNLQVAGGKPPMKVNSTGKVTNLNADRLDGKDPTDLVPGGTAPPGMTIRGHYEIDGEVSAADQLAGGDSISFVYKLPSVPPAVFVPRGSTLPPGCPGTVNSPQANPGYLCVYEDQGFNKKPGHPIVYFVSTVGAGIAQLSSDGAGDSYNSYSAGTWAVTVPNAAQAAKLPSPKKGDATAKRRGLQP